MSKLTRTMGVALALLASSCMTGNFATVYASGTELDGAYGSDGFIH